MSKILAKTQLNKIAPNLSKADKKTFLATFAKQDTREMFAGDLTGCDTQENSSRYVNDGRSVPVDKEDREVAHAFLAMCNTPLDALRFFHKRVNG